jgi:hypothetical protein
MSNCIMPMMGVRVPSFRTHFGPARPSAPPLPSIVMSCGRAVCVSAGGGSEGGPAGLVYGAFAARLGPDKRLSARARIGPPTSKLSNRSPHLVVDEHLQAGAGGGEGGR